MTLDEIRKWYDANKTHTMYEGHWCRTCSIGKLLEELERLVRAVLLEELDGWEPWIDCSVVVGHVVYVVSWIDDGKIKQQQVYGSLSDANAAFSKLRTSVGRCASLTSRRVR